MYDEEKAQGSVKLMRGIEFAILANGVLLIMQAIGLPVRWILQAEIMIAIPIGLIIILCKSVGGAVGSSSNSSGIAQIMIAIGVFAVGALIFMMALPLIAFGLCIGLLFSSGVHVNH